MGKLIELTAIAIAVSVPIWAALAYVVEPVLTPLVRRLLASRRHRA
jgi:hypothetical protein